MSEKFSDKLAKLIDGDDSAADGTEEIHGVEMPVLDMPRMSEEVIEATEYAPGYVLEKVFVTPHSADEAFEMERVVTADGHYVGEPKNAHFLIHEKGIAPELSDSENGVCSIGFCAKESKWYGWSHRAIYGFGIGDKVSEGDCTNSSGYIEEYLAEHPEEDRSLPVGFVAETLEDAKRMAVAFADSVS